MRPDREETPEILYGIHAVLEAIESGVRTIERIWVAREGGSASAGRLLRAAREAGIPITHLPREVLGRKVGRRAVHQGIAAAVSAVPYSDPEAIQQAAESTPDAIVLVADGIEDPRNLGAILRTAAAAGCSGVLLAGDGTVGLTPAAAKTAAGAAERIPVAREPRIRKRLERMREAGFQVIGLDPRATDPWDAPGLTGKLVVIAGSEARGPSRATTDCCDRRVTIPLGGGTESLNVSVAVGILLFEAVRQRRTAKSATVRVFPRSGP